MNVEAGRKICLVGSASHLSKTPVAKGNGGVRSRAKPKRFSKQTALQTNGSLKLNRGSLSQMDLITSHISHVLLNSSSVVCGKLVDLEEVAEVQLEIEEELMLGAGELGRGVGEMSWNTEGSYTGTRTERCMKGILLRHAWIARAYEETWVRFRGGGRIATETFRYEAYANSCMSA